MSTVTPQAIVARARELEIALWQEGDSLKIKGKKGTVPPKMLEVVKANKPALLAYLKTQGEPVVQEVIKLFNAKVTIDPPGYTIDDRVRELQLEAKQARLVEDKRMLAATPWYGNSGGLTHAQWHAIPKGKVWMSIVQRDPDACRRYGL
jgi:hypothetical protein